MRAFLSAVVVALMSAGSVAASESLDYVPPTATTFQAGPLMAKLAVAVAIPLVLCLVVAWGVKRAQRMRLGTADGGGRLIREGSLVLRRNCTLHLVRVDGQVLAIATDAGGVRSITVMQEPFSAVLAEKQASITG